MSGKWENEPEDVSKLYGFIYVITYEYNEQQYYYIGKKQFNSYVELDALKSGNKREGHIEFVNRRKKGKIVKKELISKESNWKKYNGSCKDPRIDDMIMISKSIVATVPYLEGHKITLTYLEEELLVHHRALYNDCILNANIGGKFFAGKIIGDKLYGKVNSNKSCN